MAAPTLTDVTAYLSGSVSATQAHITAALAAEKAAQSRTCRTPADDAAWPADLAEALKRRVARNLFMRTLPSGAETSMQDGLSMTVRVGSDPEIRRLEGPHRKRVFG